MHKAFTTEAGSLFQIDLDNKRVLRIGGEADESISTDEPGSDARWRDYLAITPLRVGDKMTFIWNLNDKGYGNCTTTSEISAVYDVVDVEYVAED